MILGVLLLDLEASDPMARAARPKRPVRGRGVQLILVLLLDQILNNVVSAFIMNLCISISMTQRMKISLIMLILISSKVIGYLAFCSLFVNVFTFLLFDLYFPVSYVYVMLY